MTHLEIRKNNKLIDISIADNWAELTAAQIIYIGDNWQAWSLMFQHDLSMRKARAMLFVKLILNKSNKELKEICSILGDYDFEANDLNLLQLTDFIFDKNKLVVNKLPEIRVGLFTKLYGPKDRLSNISIHEFSFAISNFNFYNKTKDEKYLDLLICCLYRTKSKGGLERGDLREPFNIHTADRYLKKVKRMHPALKQAIYLFFQGCLESWLILFPKVFERGDKEQENTPAGEKKTFLDIILKISGGKFGTFDQTKEEKAYLVLKDLNTVLSEKK